MKWSGPGVVVDHRFGKAPHFHFEGRAHSFPTFEECHRSCFSSQSAPSYLRPWPIVSTMAEDEASAPTTSSATKKRTTVFLDTASICLDPAVVHADRRFFDPRDEEGVVYSTLGSMLLSDDSGPRRLSVYATKIPFPDYGRQCFSIVFQQ